MFTSQFCEANGGYLTEINNLAEQAIISELGRADYSFIGFYSIGQSDPNDYVWRHSGQKVADGFLCWSEDEPNNDDERCGTIWLTTGTNPDCGIGIGWNDLNCQEVRNAVCERDPQ